MITATMFRTLVAPLPCLYSMRSLGINTKDAGAVHIEDWESLFLAAAP